MIISAQAGQARPYQYACQRQARQQGQALAEGLVLLVALLTLWAAVAWLGKMQDMALQASHASRHMAFSATRGFQDQAVSQAQLRYFLGPAHQWADRSGQLLLHPDKQPLSMVAERLSSLTPDAQPGGRATLASRLRTELGTADSGVLRTTVTLEVASNWPTLRRHTSIVIGAGHASDDAQVQQRLAISPTAWSDSSQASYELARKTDAAMGAVDAGWNRSRPKFDWLQDWTAQVPEQYLYP